MADIELSGVWGVGAGFVHPWLLGAGALLIGVPLVIHWFSRRRVRTIEWAAMRLLRGAARRDERRVRIEDRLLLALRILLVALIALLVARPLADTSWLANAGDRVEYIVLLDDSLSMQAIDAEGSAFERAQRRLGEWIESRCRVGRDQLTLRLASRPADALVERAPLVDSRREALLAAVKRLTASETRVEWPLTLDAVRRLVGGAREVRQVVLIVSDFRAVDWREASSSDRNAVDGQGTAGSEAEVDVEWIACDVGKDGMGNLAIERIEADGVAAEGVAVNYEVTVRNHGDRDARRVVVECTVGDTVPQRATLDLVAAGAKAVASFPVVIAPTAESDIEETGIAVRGELVSAEMDQVAGAWSGNGARASGFGAGNRLLRDDIAWDVAQGGGGVEVWVVQGDHAPTTLEDLRESRPGENALSRVPFISQALAPSSDFPSGYRVRVGTVEELENLPDSASEAGDLGLVDVRVLIASGGESWPEALRARIAGWIAAGGTLVLAPGLNDDATEWNKRWSLRSSRGESPLSPVELVGVVGAVDRSEWVHWVSGDDAWPAARALDAVGAAGDKSVKVFRWWRGREVARKDTSEEAAPSTIRVLARMNDADRSPGLVERSLGRGRCWWCALPLDDSASDWVADPSFVIFWQEAFRVAEDDGAARRRSLAGESYVWETVTGQARRHATVLTPNQERWAITADLARGETSRSSERWRFTTPDMCHAGIYAIEQSRENGRLARRLVAVNPRPLESDLQRVDSRWRWHVAGRETRRLEPDVPWAEQLAGTGETWKWVAWMFAGVMAVEQACGWWFGRRRG